MNQPNRRHAAHKAQGQNRATLTFLRFLAGGAFASMVALNPVHAEVGPEATASGKDAWEKTLERILSKEGIEMGGVFRSQFLFSSLGGPSAIPSLRTEEGVEFTSVDFDIKARPNKATQGRVIFRMHQDWRNFFSDIANPIFTRWISLDGEAAEGVFSYHAGDFRRHYSPLTLWSPDLEIAYEPLIFAKERQAAMDEVFLGSNDRILQGVDLNFDAEVSPLANAVHLNVLGSRLRDVETDIQNGGKPTAFIERSDVEKYLFGANLDATVLNGVDFGGTFMRIFDKKGSYTGPIPDDTAAQLTDIFALRAGANADKFLDNPAWMAGIQVEFAKSMDDSTYIADTLNNTASQSLDGTALRVEAHAGWKLENIFGVKLTAGYLKNERLYRNELTQTPSFLGERILNIDNDSAKVRTNSSTSRNYNTLDAMYRTVFKFAPVSGSNLWAKAPFNKNSYRNSIMTQGEISLASQSRLDSALQLVMPFGPATANRVGPQAKLILSGLDDNLQVQVNWSALENVEGEPANALSTYPVTKYAELGLGGKVEVAGLAGWEHPLTVSGFYGQTSADNAGIDSVFIHHKAATTQMHAGLYWNFWKRAALMGGWMQFVTDYERGAATAKVTQSRMAGGLEYKISEGAYVDATIGKVSVERDDAYGDFDQLQTSLDMRVAF